MTAHTPHDEVHGTADWYCLVSLPPASVDSCSSPLLSLGEFNDDSSLLLTIPALPCVSAANLDGPEGDIVPKPSLGRLQFARRRPLGPVCD